MDREDLKKIGELFTFRYFTPIYEIVTGDTLELIEASERPDFICKKNGSEVLGVELVRITRGDPNEILFDEIINKTVTMEPDRAIDLIRDLILKKEEKRKSAGWKYPDKTILLIELVESPLWEFPNLTEEVFPDLQECGFHEVWLTDSSELEAYRNVELFCLFPPSLWGYYGRPPQKPYG